jgi:hypothetical protein
LQDPRKHAVDEQAAYRSIAMPSLNVSSCGNRPMIAINPARANDVNGRMPRRLIEPSLLQGYEGAMPSIARRRNIASIRRAAAWLPQAQHGMKSKGEAIDARQ